jgi:peptidyl-prolyl cis-trans isomerase D
MFQGKFDEEKAKQMHLQEQVLNSMASKALILNLANEFGIIVSDEEVAQELASIPIFLRNGVFDKSIYKNYLKNNGLSVKTFENSIRDDMIIQKTLTLLNLKGVEEEYDNFKIAFEIGDKLKYKILSPKDINVTLDEAKLKEFWEGRKEEFQTPKKYTFDIVWVETKDVNVTTEELQQHFNENSFKYTDTKGKLLTFDEAKPQVVREVKLKKSKRDANKKYIAFKKGKIAKDETITYDINDFRLPREVWSEVTSKNIGDLLKPKVVGERYASIKIVDIQEPTVKPFEDAKSLVEPLYRKEQVNELLAKLSEESLESIDEIATETSGFITLENIEKQKLGLNKQESAELASKLFTSDQEKGIISIGDKVVVYKIIEQKLVPLDKNGTLGLKSNVDQIKQKSFQSNLMRELDKKYPTKYYK